jgi:hypothetical protein
MMKNRLTDQTGNDVDVDVDALLAAINEISESEVHRTRTTRSTSALMAAGITPGANWRRHLNSIFMISAPVKPTAKQAKKIPTRRSRDQTC